MWSSSSTATGQAQLLRDRLPADRRASAAAHRLGPLPRPVRARRGGAGGSPTVSSPASCSATAASTSSGTRARPRGWSLEAAPARVRRSGALRSPVVACRPRPERWARAPQPVRSQEMRDLYEAVFAALRGRICVYCDRFPLDASPRRGPEPAVPRVLVRDGVVPGRGVERAADPRRRRCDPRSDRLAGIV